MRRLVPPPCESTAKLGILAVKWELPGVTNVKLAAVSFVKPPDNVPIAVVM